MLYWDLFKLIIRGKASLRFLLGLALSLAFSMTVILSTIGLMDGFDHALKRGLKRASGEVILYNRLGYFSWGEFEDEVVAGSPFPLYSPFIQVEAFLSNGEKSTGVLVRGVEPESFRKVTGLELPSIFSGMILGSHLPTKLEVKPGDKLALIMPRGNESVNSLPYVERLIYEAPITHGVFEKDSRLVYLPIDVLRSIIKIKDQVNVVTLKQAERRKFDAKDEIFEIRRQIENFPRALGTGFVLKPYWSEYAHLIEAVEVEKKTILLVLQVIVILTLFNFVAFIWFLHEKKSQEIFLFHALGASRKMVKRVWKAILSGLWLSSCFIAYFLVQFFDWGLQNLSFFDLPGDIYNLINLYLVLGPGDYILVFGIAYFWLLIIGYLGQLKESKRSLIQNLREEFT